MGKLDTESKKYLGNPKIFADLFNSKLFNGEQIIKAGDLRPLDTTEVAIPFGNGARVPVQKYRDILKLWTAMQDSDGTVYVVLGGEEQSKIHYAEAVKCMLYDALNYSSQVDAIRRSYKDNNYDAEIVVENDEVRITKLTQDEFLSGLRKDDKLIPVVTVVVYLGDKTWDAPLSLHEMLNVKDKRILQAVADYKVNLVSAVDMSDFDLETKFSTGLGYVLQAIKHNKHAIDFMAGSDKKWIDIESANFLGAILDIDIDFSRAEKKGEVNVGEATKEYLLNRDILAVYKYLKDEGKSEKEMVKILAERFNVTEEHVREVINPAAA